MYENEFRISMYDRISRHSTFISLYFVFLFFLIILYAIRPWLSEVGAPEFTAITVSVIALVLSAAEVRRSFMLGARQDDIKALHGLRSFRFIMENPKETKPMYNFDELRDKSISEIDEAIPGTSSRFRKELYWISLELRHIPLEYLSVYLIRQKSILAGAADDEFPKYDPRIVTVEKILNICKLMIDRIEYVYFGESIRPEYTLIEYFSS